MSSDRISPTAHYTGYVWARNGLSHPELETGEGRLLYESLRLPNTVASMLGRDSLEHYLLARHRAIDAVLKRAIDSGEVRQVIEIACGMSPRGWRFSRRYGDALTYVEADLPGMAARKRAALQRAGSLDEHHRVVEIDALRDDGAGSLAGVIGELDLDRSSGLAIITEGLTGYLDTESLLGMWRRFATVLGTFASGRYISDLHLASTLTPEIRAFRLALSAFVRGAVHLHFETAEAAVRALREAGFAQAELIPAGELVAEGRGRGGRRVHILEASTSTV